MKIIIISSMYNLIIIITIKLEDEVIICGR